MIVVGNVALALTSGFLGRHNRYAMAAASVVLAALARAKR